MTQRLPSAFIPSFSNRTLTVLTDLLPVGGHMFLGKQLQFQLKMKHDPFKPIAVVPFPVTLADLDMGLCAVLAHE